MNDEHGLKRLLFIVHRSAFIVLFSCASPAPTPPTALPPLEAVPRGVLDAFCSRLHEEGFSSETSMEVVKTTQPLITPQAMTALADTAFYGKPYDPYVMAEAAKREAAALPVVVPGDACSWRAVDANARRAVDTMTVELSAPLTNPFARNSVGLFARISLGRESATWYWVPLAIRGERWVAGQPMMLGMR